MGISIVASYFHHVDQEGMRCFYPVPNVEQVDTGFGTFDILTSHLPTLGKAYKGEIYSDDIETLRNECISAIAEIENLMEFGFNVAKASSISQEEGRATIVTCGTSHEMVLHRIKEVKALAEAVSENTLPEMKCLPLNLIWPITNKYL